MMRKGSDPMLAWFSANLVNIALTAAVALIVGLLIFVMVRDKKAGKSSCGGSCASCGGSCGGCSACAGCHSASPAADMNDPNGIPGNAH